MTTMADSHHDIRRCDLFLLPYTLCKLQDARSPCPSSVECANLLIFRLHRSLCIRRFRQYRINVLRSAAERFVQRLASVRIARAILSIMSLQKSWVLCKKMVVIYISISRSFSLATISSSSFQYRSSMRQSFQRKSSSLSSSSKSPSTTQQLQKDVATNEPEKQWRKTNPVNLFFQQSISSGLLVAATSIPLLTIHTLPANAVFSDNDWPQGISIVTQSELGKSIRSSVVGGAKLVDRLDLQWERFSDSLRDEAKCDARTNRRMFDNGKRRDGTPIGNPVLGALCTPEPLRELDQSVAKSVLEFANAAAMKTWKLDEGSLQKAEKQVQELVGPSFSRAASSLEDMDTRSIGDGSIENTQSQQIKRQMFNRDLYVNLRAFGELVRLNNNDKSDRESALLFERNWGDKLLGAFARNANRNDFISPFPKPDDTENEPYDEGALLDAMGQVSVALNTLQQGGVIGHWEISIPEDDDWNVVTIAIDDDICIGGQIIARERQQALGGSAVVAMVRAAMDNHAKISYKINTFFIDPTTTRQELYQPSQLLISLNDLGQ
jgi:hypothetical protein